MNIKISKKRATYSILEQHEDKSKHSDERLTKMIFKHQIIKFEFFYKI